MTVLINILAVMLGVLVSNLAAYSLGYLHGHTDARKRRLHDNS